MKKQLFSTAAASMLLLASTGATAAVISTPTGVSVFLSTTGFKVGDVVTNPDLNPATFTTTFTFAPGVTQTIDFTNTSFTNSHAKLIIPPGNVPGTGEPPVIGPSGTGTIPPLSNLGPDPILLPIGPTTIFWGSGSATFPVASLTFDGTNQPSIGLGDQFSFTYNGLLDLGQLLNNPALPNFPLIGSLTGTVTDVRPTSLTLDFTETCTPINPTGLGCVWGLLNAVDAGTSEPGVVSFVLGLTPGTELVVPEPASLALMGIGIAGLGIARRKKEAA